MQPASRVRDTSSVPRRHALSEDSVGWSHAAFGYWMVGLSLLCITRIAGLTRQSLWYDEGYSLTLASSPTFHEFTQRFASLTTSEHLQPLYYLLLFWWSHIAGVSDFALRLPSALASIGSGLMIYRIGVRLPHATRRFALAATVFYTISSYALFYAQEARPYALSQLVALAVMASWIRNKQTLPSRNRRFAVLCIVSTLCSLFTLLLLCSLALADLLTERSLRVWVHVWRFPIAACTLALSLYLTTSFYLFPHVVAQDVTSLKQPLWMNAWYTLYSLAFGTTLQPSSQLLRGPHKMQMVLHFWPIILPASLIILALIVGAYLLLMSAKNPHPASRPIALTIVLYSLALFCGLGMIGHLNLLPRHASVLFALLLVFGLLVALQISSSKSMAGKVCFSGGLFGLILINLISIGYYRYDADCRKDDYRAAAQALNPGTSDVFMTEGQPGLMQHYGARVVDATKVNPERLSEFLRVSSQEAPHIRIVVNESRGFRWDHRRSVADELAATYSCAEDRHYPYMELLSCTLKPVSSGEDQAGTLLSLFRNERSTDAR